MEHRALIRRAVLATSVAAAIGATAVATGRREEPARPPGTAPTGVRVRVEVLNATQRRGLARRATLVLRDRGFDVVDVGTAPESRHSTLIIDRSGRADLARRVARALGDARVERQVDSSRYLDVTVLLGPDWTPPAEPFYP